MTKTVKTDWKDVLIRSGKTFLEGFLSCVAMWLAGIVFTDSLADMAWKSMLLNSVSAGITTLINGFLIPWLKGKNMKPGTTDANGDDETMFYDESEGNG